MVQTKCKAGRQKMKEMLKTRTISTIRKTEPIVSDPRLNQDKQVPKMGGRKKRKEGGDERLKKGQRENSGHTLPQGVR